MWMIHVTDDKLRPVMDALHVCVVQATMNPADRVQLPRKSPRLAWLKWVRDTEAA